MRSVILALGLSAIAFAFSGAAAADWGSDGWGEGGSNPGLGGGTVYHHSDGSSSQSSQTLGGGTMYRHSDGSSTQSRSTLGGGTVYEHSDGSRSGSGSGLGW